MKKDLRSHERRIPIGKVYTALGRGYERVGKLIDLSMGGLAFVYMSDGNSNMELSQVDILKVGEVFNLYNLTCKIVYDILLPPLQKSIKSLKQSHNRRCGVKFDNLTTENNFQLGLFLKSHTKNDFKL